MGQLRNPIIRGFNPDPSIVRVDEDYYIATSTFEWFPAVRLHHSTDLIHWRTIGHALQLDLGGIPASGGIWAPSLSYHDGLFWLVYTVVRTTDGPAKDLDNYLVTAPAITGPWSEPVRLDSRGFDASLFHDADGRRWIVGVQWDPRPGRNSFAGISLQEYDHAARRLVGENRVILRDVGLVEGPNLYRHDGRYYLMLAQGGTGFNHGITMARADSIDGVYERDPEVSVLTSRHDPSLALQKAGHGELVETSDGALYLVHLASRATAGPGGRFCLAGRETCLQRVAWDDQGWLRLADDDGRPLATSDPRVEVVVSGPSSGSSVSPDLVDDFDAAALDSTVWSALRRPVRDTWADLAVRPGWLRLVGGQSPASRFDQSLVATRVCEPELVATTVVQATPRTPRHRCGLVAWYDATGYYYAFLTVDDAGRRIVALETSGVEGVGWLPGALDAQAWPLVHLRFRVEAAFVSFDAGPDGTTWYPLGSPLPADVVSDDYAGLLRFTGCFAALRADDHDGDSFVADFDRLELRYRF